MKTLPHSKDKGPVTSLAVGQERPRIRSSSITEKDGSISMDSMQTSLGSFIGVVGIVASSSRGMLVSIIWSPCRGALVSTLIPFFALELKSLVMERSMGRRRRGVKSGEK